MEPQRRLLLVHAHPDDETISNGATMARYAAEGAQVSLLTCTLGEFGEIIVPGLAELEWDKGNQLGGYRVLELDRAMAALGVGDHRFLGGAGHFHDSGMMGTPGNQSPRAFWRAAADRAVYDDAVAAAVRVIRDVRPHVVVTYDENGGYGHPDHIMAHRVTMAAVAAAGDASYPRAGADVWSAAKVYWNVLPRSALTRAVRDVAAGEHPFTVAGLDDFPFAADDAAVTTVIDASAHRAAKRAAMQAHATQISVHGDFFALSNGLGQAISGVEYYRLVRGRSGATGAAPEDDLFAGVAL